MKFTKEFIIIIIEDCVPYTGGFVHFFTNIPHHPSTQHEHVSKTSTSNIRDGVINYMIAPLTIMSRFRNSNLLDTWCDSLYLNVNLISSKTLVEAFCDATWMSLHAWGCNSMWTLRPHQAVCTGTKLYSELKNKGKKKEPRNNITKGQQKFHQHTPLHRRARSLYIQW